MSYLKSLPLLPDDLLLDPLEESPAKSPKKSSNMSEKDEVSNPPNPCSLSEPLNAA